MFGVIHAARHYFFHVRKKPLPQFFAFFGKPVRPERLNQIPHENAVGVKIFPAPLVVGVHNPVRVVKHRFVAQHGIRFRQKQRNPRKVIQPQPRAVLIGEIKHFARFFVVHLAPHERHSLFQSR